MSMPGEGLNVNGLEEILIQEVRRFARELWESILASLPVLPRAPGLSSARTGRAGQGGQARDGRRGEASLGRKPYAR